MTRDCYNCNSWALCAYRFIFAPNQNLSIKRIKDPPRGFVLKPPLDIVMEYTQDRPLCFHLVLIGTITQALPWFIVALNLLGEHGIGRNNGRFLISDISIWNGDNYDSIYDYSTRSIAYKDIKLTIKDFSDFYLKPRNTITLTFLTPTRITYNLTGKKGGSILVKVPEFHHLMRRLLSRISLLTLLYCQSSISIDFEGLIERSKHVSILDQGLFWYHRSRKSGTMKDARGRPAVHDQSGFMGKITYEGELTEFLPLLTLGQYLHVGEDAVFGNGWYRIEPPLGIQYPSI
jgi:hypothetical protein